MAIKNIKKVTGNLNRKIKDIKNRSIKGLTVAALQIRKDSQLKTPVDEGNLRASAYTETSRTSTGARATIGYTAEYAAWVHEAPGTLKGKPRPKKAGSNANRGFFWDPQNRAEPKFLQKAAFGNEKKILETIIKHVKS